MAPLIPGRDLHLLLASACLACSALAAGCSLESRSPKPRLVLLYAPCTVSARHLSPYAPGVSFTPSLDAFSREAMVFERQQTETGLSGIAYASILTGRQADGHGIHTHPRRLAGDLLLLPEVFATAGWQTWFFDAHDMASARLDYGQGVPPGHVFEGRQLAGGDLDLDEILAGLAANPEQRAFVMSFFSVTHAPYGATRMPLFCREHPESCSAGGAPIRPEQLTKHATLHEQNHTHLSYDYERRVGRLGLTDDDLREHALVVEAIYRSRIQLLDEMFGGVLASIREHGLESESLVAFTADHGEVLHRENARFKWAHGHGLAPEVLHVPLILRGPGVPAGRFRDVTRSIDLLPTIASLAGVELPTTDGIEGEDRAPEIRGDRPARSLDAFSHTAPLHTWPRLHDVEESQLRRLYPDEDPRWIWVGMRTGDRVVKLRNRGDGVFEPVAFDLETDPGEERNLFDPEALRDREAFAKLAAYKRRLSEAFTPSAAHAAQGGVPVERQRELLRRLGYVE